MKGIIVDCKTNEAREQDDGLPMPEYVPMPEIAGLDLAVAREKIDRLEADVAELKARA